MSFFSDQVLNKRGPLGKVWLASHLERKLSKSALLQTNIPNSVTAILGGAEDEVVPVMALRLSGQLLLGVARIYSRKAKYLQDDCSEAYLKIKLAFRTAPNAGGLVGGNGARARGARGDVDMVEDDAGRANINLNLGGDARGANDFDVLYNAEFGGFGIWEDFDMNPLVAPQTTGKDRSNRITVTNVADITLREDHNLDLDYDRTIDLNFGDELGIGSQEYRARSVDTEGGLGFGDDFELGLDLDLELDLGLMDDDLPLGGREGTEGVEDGQRRDESPAAYVARQRNKTTGPSRVASIAAQARELSEAPSEALSEVPSVELGRDAATPLSIRNSDIVGQGQQGVDNSLLKGIDQGDSFDMDLGGPDFAPAGDDTTFDFGGDQYDTSLPQEAPRGPSRSVSRQPEAALHATDEDQANDATNTEGDETQTQIDMTPNTAARVADAAALGSAQRKRKENVEGAAARAKPAKVRKQIVDSVTELVERGRGLAGRDSQSQGTVGGVGLSSREERMAQGLLKEPKYIPATTVEMRFQEIYDNPNKYFFAGMAGFATNSKTASVNTFYAGPPGMPAQLQSLFQFRVGDKGQILGSKRVPEVTVENLDGDGTDRRKRARSSAVPDVELGRDRQQSLTPGEGDGLFDFGGAADNFDDFGAGGDSANNFSLDLGNMSPGIGIANAAAALEKTPSRLGTPRATPSPGMLDASLRLDFDALDRANGSILAVFDETPLPKAKNVSTPAGTGRTGKNGYLSVPGTRQSGISEEQSLLEESVQSASIAASRGRMGGWNKNTVKALKILEHELGPAPSHAGEDADEGEEEAKTISFQALSEKASRKAAASMFFEMLVLGTRDCIKLKQSEAYGDISVTSKDKLWQVCNGLNQLSMDHEEDEGSQRPSRQATPMDGSSEAGETPTRQSQSRANDSTPVASSSRSRMTAQMSM